MTARDKHIAQKKKEILKISRVQARLILKSAKIIYAPCKRTGTLMKRMLKVLEIAMQVRALDIQKQIIASQPIPLPTPNFIPGGVVPGGPAIVGKAAVNKLNYRVDYRPAQLAKWYTFH